jgi:hypothetical protein
MLNQLKPTKPFDSTYSGIELLDIDNLANINLFEVLNG